MKLKTILLVLAALLFLGGLLIASRSVSLGLFSRQKPTVLLDGHVFDVVIADTEEKRNAGLSGREMLRENEGMLFVFDKLATPPFWMKGMKFPIDILWIEDHRIVGFVQDAAVESEGEQLKLYNPPQPVNYVLEVKAGTVARLDIHRGAAFEIR